VQPAHGVDAAALEQLRRAVSWYAFACVNAAAARALTSPWHSGASSITADQ
jgi:hypothetical protein